MVSAVSKQQNTQKDIFLEHSTSEEVPIDKLGYTKKGRCGCSEMYFRNYGWTHKK